MHKLKAKILIILILLISGFLEFFHLNVDFPFIGDQGWFYISARDMLLTGKIPLVGITSSHVWLHQGPYWTYMLAGVLFLSHFNPVAGAYLTALIGLCSVFLMYHVGSVVFSRRVGLIASLLYATSPLVISYSRMPYHTSVIATLTLLLFYTIYKWINGFRYGFPLSILLLALLYNFETATFMLVPVFSLLLVYGYIQKTDWIKDIYSPKMLLFAVCAWVIVMIPMILYDIHHGYPQTFKFILWLGYKVATVFGYPKLHPGPIGETYQTMFPFASTLLQELIYFKSAILSWIFLLISVVNLLQLNLQFFKKGSYLQSYSLLFLFFIVPAIGYIVERTNSGAYWEVFFPPIIYMLALVFDRFMQPRKFFLPTTGILLLFVLSNIIFFFQSNYFVVPFGFSIVNYEAASQKIIQESHGKAYNLQGKGPGSQYISFTMNFEYLTWWMGHGPTKTKEPLRFIIQETPTKILVTKQFVNF